MSKFWFKLRLIWPYIIAALIILAFLFWPFFALTGDRNSLSYNIFSKIIGRKLNSLVVNQTKNENIKQVPENVLVFGGDIMLSRSVNNQMEKYQDYSWPFLKISSLFYDADLAVANLESPFVFANNYSVPSGSFSFKANPRSVLGLSLAGFDVLSLANNHILNQGTKGLTDTSKILDGAEISYTGVASKNLVVKESNGIKFGFLSYTYAPDSKLIANMLDITKAKADIVAAKSQADVIIVLMHAGTEYTYTPNEQQREFSHAVIDSGADLVVGSHPHWPQSIENYQGKTIIYSLGNLIFDQMWSRETRVGLIAKIYFKNKEVDKIEYIPIEIKDYGQTEVIPDGLIKDNLFKTLGVK